MSRHATLIARAAGTIALVLWFVFATLVIVLRYLVLPHVGDYRVELEQRIGQALGETVRIGSMTAAWQGLRPAVTIRDVEVTGADGTRTLTLPSAEAVLSWRSLAVLQVRLSSLDLDGADLLVRRDASGRIFVAGFPLQRKAAPDHRGLDWLLAQQQVRIRHGRLTWRDDLGVGGGVPPPFVVTDVAFAMERSGLHHRVALRATPPAAVAAPLDVRAIVDHSLLSGDDADPADWRGEIYADVAAADVAAWRAWLPLPDTLDSGRGRVRGWLRFTRDAEPAGSFVRRLAERTGRPLPAALDRVSDLTADLALDDVAVRWGTMESAGLAAIDGRVVASQTTTAQHFSAQRMALQPRGNVRVAPTDFAVDRTVGSMPDDESGHASLGAVDIGVSLGLVPLALVPPAIAARLAALKTHGILDRVAVTWTGPVATPKTFVADARFARLGIAAQAPTSEAVAKAAAVNVAPNGLMRRPHQAFGTPGFDGLDGTLHATRTAATAPDPEPVTEVALSVVQDDAAGHEAVVVAPGLFDDPVLRFTELSGDVTVRVHGLDLEARVARAAIANADLAATTDLVFRNGPNSGGGDSGRGWIDLDARFGRADVSKVARYLPNLISDKARAYLSKALVSGHVDAATLRMLGPLDRLDLRAQPGALAAPYPVPLQAVLAGVRDGVRPPASAASVTPSTASAKAPAAVGTSDAAAPLFHADIHVRDATYLYGPARSAADAALVNAQRNAAAAPGAAAAPALPSIAWPAFDHVDADIAFDQARMVVRAHTARYRGFVLENVTAELPALADPTHVLRVSGRGRGPLQDLVRFVNEGPVSRWIKQAADNTRATGDATFALALDLPLSHPRDTSVVGAIGFSGNELVLNAIVPPFRQIRGRVDFSDRGVTIDGLTAESLGGPLRIDASTGADGWIDLKAAGMVDIAALRAEGPPEAAVRTPVSAGVERATQVMSGSARYAASFRLLSSRVAALADDRAPPAPANSSSRSELKIESDLTGLAIDLPEPFAKAADAAWPLRIDLSRASSAAAPTADREDIHVTLADRARFTITRQRDADGHFSVARAGYRVGSGAARRDGAVDGAVDGASDGAAVGAVDGVSDVLIDVPLLDLDAWRAVARRLASARPPAESVAPAGNADRLLPTRATLRTATLRAAGRDFTNLTASAERVPSGWTARIAADQIAGTLSYTDVSGRTDKRSGVAPASSGLVVARLSRLSIPASESGRAHVEDTLDASRQRDFPGIDAIVDDFDLRGRSLGKLEVVAQNVGSGSGGDAGREWRLEKLALTTPETRFVGHGVWGHDRADEHTELDFELASSDVGALMDRFGLTRTIKNGDARLSGNAAWQGGPTTIDFGTLAGSLRLAADRGQFLKADPGIAKLLNILSLQGLARTLTFDFDDVFGAGFAFDTVRADARIEHGIATTDDFTMQGLQATVRMSGQADLEHETTDLHVVVLPQINAGAASLGLAVVNPVAGLATFAAQYLFKDRISQALSFEYNVTGPWAKPQVVKIDRKGRVTPVKPKADPK